MDRALYMQFQVQSFLLMGTLQNHNNSRARFVFRTKTFISLIHRKIFRFLIDVAEQDTGRFFMRLQIRAPVTREDFEARIRPVADRFKMEWHLDVVGRKMRVSVSPEVHLTKS
jgi:formyltetrahydrofolate hydrolase